MTASMVNLCPSIICPTGDVLKIMRIMLFGNHQMSHSVSPDEEEKIIYGPMGRAAYVYAKAIKYEFWDIQKKIQQKIIKRRRDRAWAVQEKKAKLKRANEARKKKMKKRKNKRSAK